MCYRTASLLFSVPLAIDPSLPIFDAGPIRDGAQLLWCRFLPEQNCRRALPVDRSISDKMCAGISHTTSHLYSACSSQMEVGMGKGTVWVHHQKRRGYLRIF
eukprot:TRINITY_DN19712_c0_g1_i1.p1 TRINITY_DN19712_c0_g1~~TRINITY_DN19712_c0_g1_i1.p1  ORF type:complete len:102 (+),score=2.80 TRINITY_DN19712_c0_g1_i1:275-580(+)